MTYEKALILLVPAFLICSALIIALTEALKKALGWSGTITSSVVSLLVPVAVTAAYCICTGTVPNAVMIVFLVFLIFCAWIGATLGFDKAKELIEKILSIIKGKEDPAVGDFDDEEFLSVQEDDKSEEKSDGNH